MWQLEACMEDWDEYPEGYRRVGADPKRTLTVDIPMWWTMIVELRRSGHQELTSDSNTSSATITSAGEQ